MLLKVESNPFESIKQVKVSISKPSKKVKVPRTKPNTKVKAR